MVKHPNMKPPYTSRKAARKEDRQKKKDAKKKAYESHNGFEPKKNSNFKSKKKPNNQMNGLKKIITESNKEAKSTSFKNHIHKKNESEASSSGLQFSQNNLSSRMAALQEFINNETKSSGFNHDSSQSKSSFKDKNAGGKNQKNSKKKSKQLQELEKGIESDTKEINELQRQLRLNAKQKKSNQMLSNLFGEDIGNLFEMLEQEPEPGKEWQADEESVKLPSKPNKIKKAHCKLPENTIRINTKQAFSEDDDVVSGEPSDNGINKLNLTPLRSKKLKQNSISKGKKHKIPIEIEYDESPEDLEVTPIIKRSKSRNKKGQNISFSLEDTTVRLIPTIVKESGFIVADKDVAESYLDVSCEDVPKFLQEDNLKSMYEAEQHKNKLLKKKNKSSLKKKTNGTSYDEKLLNNGVTEQKGSKTMSKHLGKLGFKKAGDSDFKDANNDMNESYESEEDDFHMVSQLTDSESEEDSQMEAEFSDSGDDVHMEAVFSDSDDGSSDDDSEPSSSNCDADKKSSVPSERTQDTTELKEDIYGRLRDSEGNIVDTSSDSTGYSGPLSRKNDKQLQEQLNTPDIKRVRTQLRGRLNRLAEVNLHGTVTMVSINFK